METITISKKEYEEIKQKAQVSEGLLKELVEGLNDAKAGRIKPLKEISAE